jgi:hypothetical protein
MSATSFVSTAAVERVRIKNPDDCPVNGAAVAATGDYSPAP